MKTAEEWEQILNELYWNVEHGLVKNGVEKLSQWERDAERSGYERGVREAAQEAKDWQRNYVLPECCDIAQDSAAKEIADNILSLTTKPEDKPL